MHDRDILPPDVVDDDLADLGGVVPVPEEEEVSALEGRLHAAGEDDDDGGGGVGEHGEGLPEHEGRAEDEGEVEDLERRLARVLQERRWEGGQHI